MRLPGQEGPEPHAALENSMATRPRRTMAAASRPGPLRTCHGDEGPTAGGDQGQQDGVRPRGPDAGRGRLTMGCCTSTLMMSS